LTFREALTKDLEARGLFGDEATNAIAAYEQSEPGAAMRGRLDDQMEGYGPDGTGVKLFTGVRMGVDAEVVKWMDAEKPGHWARELFAS